MESRSCGIVLPVYIISDIHLAGQLEEVDNITKQFLDKSEFNLYIRYMKSVENSDDNYDELEQVISIVDDAKKAGDDVLILARSSHVFTEGYSFDDLYDKIIKGNRLGTKVLYCSAGSCKDAIYLSDNLFWVQYVESTSFVVLYRSFFDSILEHRDCALGLFPFEVLLNTITTNKFITCKALVYRGLSEQLGGGGCETTNRQLTEIMRQTQKFSMHHPFLRERKVLEFTDQPVLNGSIRVPSSFDSAENIFIRSAVEERIVVLVPFYNAGVFLSQCLDSITTQDYKNFEIILLDDCSDDNAIIQLKPLADIPMKVIKSESRSFALQNLHSCLKNLHGPEEAIVVCIKKNMDFFWYGFNSLLVWGLK